MTAESMAVILKFPPVTRQAQEKKSGALRAEGTLINSTVFEILFAFPEIHATL